MPSVFTLEGPPRGAIAVPTGRRTFHYGLPTHSPALMGNLGDVYLTHPRGGARLMGSLGAAVATGFGEISSGTKTGLLALGMLGLVGLVFYHGNETARRRGRALFGSRRRRRWRR